MNAPRLGLCRGSRCCRRSSAIRSRTSGCSSVGQRAGRQPRQGPVEPLEVQPVHGVRDGGADQRRQLRCVPPQRRERGQELLPRAGDQLRMSPEQLVVPAERDLLGHQRPQVPAQVQWPRQRVDHVGGEEVRDRRPATAQRVLGLRVVGRTPRRPDDQARLRPRGHVPAVDEPTPAPLEQQHDEIDEREPQPAREHGLPRLDDREIRVRGLLRRDVPQPALARRGLQRELGGRGCGVQVPGREDHGVRDQRRLPVQGEDLPPADLGQPGRPHRVHVHPDLRREPVDDRTQHRGEVSALQPPAREGRRRDRPQLGDEVLRPARDVRPRRRPVREGGPGHDRALADHRVVRPHRDVPGHRVHREQRGLRVPPDPSRARGVRVDEVDVQIVGQQLGRARRDPFQDPDAARPGPDDRDGCHEGPLRRCGQVGKDGLRERRRYGRDRRACAGRARSNAACPSPDGSAGHPAPHSPCGAGHVRGPVRRTQNSATAGTTSAPSRRIGSISDTFGTSPWYSWMPSFPSSSRCATSSLGSPPYPRPITVFSICA